MPERDSLNSDNFNALLGSGKYLKFRDGVPLTLRVLTTDPVISESEFTDKTTGEITLRTQFAFIVYNFTEEKAQILSASPSIARWIGDKHTDPDFGANIRNIDIKITPTGEGLQRRYDLQVLPKPRTLTAAMIEEAKTIDLDNSVRDSKGRMSQLVAAQNAHKAGVGSAGDAVGSSGSSTPGYDNARAKVDAIKNGKPQDDLEAANAAADASVAANGPDPVIEDIDPDTPPNLDEIPF